MQQLTLGMRLPDRAVFASFLPARNNEALEHARRAAGGEIAGATWICGPGSAGKTHLLQAICSQVAESRRAGYFPLAELASLGVGVLDGLPQLQCVCLDGLEAVAGRVEWEKAIFGLLRELEECGGTLVMAARPPPAPTWWSGSRCSCSAWAMPR